MGYLTAFIQNSDIVEEYELSYVLFVEGASERALLMSLQNELQLPSSVSIHELGGKDRAKIDKLRLVLKSLKDKKQQYFVILDGTDEHVPLYGADLVREGFVEDTHLILWERTLEDALPLNKLYAALREIKGTLPFTLPELQTELKNKPGFVEAIEKLSHIKRNKIIYQEIKVQMAQNI